MRENIKKWGGRCSAVVICALGKWFWKPLQLYLSKRGSVFGVQATKFLSIYLLTPWCKVLLEKLTGLQLIKKFPAFHGT